MATARTDIDTQTAPRTAPVGACPLCGERESTLHLRLPDRLHGTPGEYTYRRCSACRTVFQDPRVIADDLALCYPGTYYTHATAEAVETSDLAGAGRAGGFRAGLRRAVVAAVRNEPRAPGLVGVLGRWLAMIPEARRRAFFGHVDDALLPWRAGPLRALDIGCGGGLLMAAMRRVGYEVEGAEWDSAAAAVARRSNGSRVVEGDFRTADLAPGRYDLITLSHVFEHLDDPIGALRRIGELLAPGGRAVLWYPNPESLGSRVFGGSWFPWEVPRHLVLPPADAVARAARMVGLVPLRVTTTARQAANFLAYSASYQAGRTIGDVWPPRGTLWTRTLAAVERSLVGLGLPLGEEVRLVLTRE